MIKENGNGATEYEQEKNYAVAWAKRHLRLFKDWIDDTIEKINTSIKTIEDWVDKIKNKGIVTDYLADGAVTTGKIKDGNVTTAKLKDSAVTTEKIDDGAVTGAKIGKGEVAHENLAENSVWHEQLGNKAVTTENIADGAVTSGKYARGSVGEYAVDEQLQYGFRLLPVSQSGRGFPETDESGETYLRVGEITPSDGAKRFSPIRQYFFTSTYDEEIDYFLAEKENVTYKVYFSEPDKIQTAERIKLQKGRTYLTCTNYTYSLISSEPNVYKYVQGVADITESYFLRDGGITADYLADNAVTADKIKDHSVIFEKLGPESVGYANMRTASVDGQHILSGAIGTKHLNDGSVTEEKLADDAVTTDKIKDYTITMEKLAADAKAEFESKADKATTDGGFAGGDGAATASGGGAVGRSATVEAANDTDGGFAGGSSAGARCGGAIGHNAKETGNGFAGGENALTAAGGAIGDSAASQRGGAVGLYAFARDGGAVGYYASETGGGFAGGDETATSSGVAIGANAKTVDAQGNGIDAIQLGTGTNSEKGTVQAYDYKLMDADGKIPIERLPDDINADIIDELKAKKLEQKRVDDLLSASVAYDFNDGKPLFSVPSLSGKPNGSSTTEADAENGGYYQVIAVGNGTIGSTSNVYSQFKFGNVTENASSITLELDFQYTGNGRIRLAIADLDVINSLSNSDIRWNTKGIAADIFSNSNNNFQVNGKDALRASLFGVWLHAKFDMDFSAKKVQYKITSKTNPVDTLEGNVDFRDTECARITGIAFYTWLQNDTVYIDNISVKALYDARENTRYIVGTGDVYKEYAYINGEPVLLGRSDAIAAENGAITEPLIANRAVTEGKIAMKAVGTDELADKSVVTRVIADKAVTGYQLAEGAVNYGHIANDAVINSKIANDAVTTGKITDGAVNDHKLADGAVTMPKLAEDVKYALKDISERCVYFGECASAADETDKSVEIPGFELKNGAAMIVRFTNGNSRGKDFNLNINDTGSKTVVVNGVDGFSLYGKGLDAGTTILLSYDADNDQYILVQSTATDYSETSHQSDILAVGSVGSATQPVYFVDGAPKQTDYTLEKSVPADAEFTDTTYDPATTDKAGLMSAEDKKKLDNTELDIEDLKAYLGYTDDDIVGLCVDYENKTFTRLAGAAGKTAGADFDGYEMFGGRKRCTVSDDGEITSWYGDDNYAEDGSMGQVMVYQPAFYYRVVPLKLEPQTDGVGYHQRKTNYYVSSKPKPGFKRHPLFYDKNGDEVGFVLLSAYEGSIFDVSEEAYLYADEQVMTVGEDKFCSISGVKPASGKEQLLARQNVEKLAQNRGSDWHCDLIKAVSANQLLMMIEMGTMNMQTAIGMGVVSIPNDPNTENHSVITGGTSALGNDTGMADGVNGKAPVSYRGMENPWGNIWKYAYGVNIYGNGSQKGGIPYICTDFNFAESKNSGNYESVGFTVTNKMSFISAMGYSNENFDWIFCASESLGNSSVPVGDYTYATPDLNGYRTTMLGGFWGNGSGGPGVFCWSAVGGVNLKARRVGGRLLYVPTKDTAAAYEANIAAWNQKMTR